MFESATFESLGTIHTRSRSWMFATFGFNASILALLAAIPLLHPAMLPQMFRPIVVDAPAPAEEVHPIAQPAHPTVTPTETYPTQIVVPRQIPVGAWNTHAGDDSAAVGAAPIDLCGSCTASADNPFTGHHSPPVIHPPVPPTLQRVTSHLMEANLINKVIPAYPPLARAMHASGRVELQATISRAGAIENLRVLSGPAVFQQAALDAVRQWRYQPYLLNGQPVEVETTINVDFAMN